MFGLITVVGLALVLTGVAQRHKTGLTGSPLLALLPALLSSIFLIYYLSKIWVFRDMRSGRSAIARWTLPAAQFDRFRDEEQRIPAGSIMTNFYEPPKTTPAEGVEVIFSKDGVLIGGGYFPLSITGRRRLQSVRYVPSHPPSIEFVTVLRTAVRTSSVTTHTYRTAESLRVPVSSDATMQAGEVVRRYQSIIDSRS